MMQIAINTSQNVTIDFQLASIGDRIIAFIIDTLIQGAYFVLVYIISIRFIAFNSFLENTDQWSIAAIFILIMFPAYLYTLACEATMEGQTFGKKIMKIKVVKIDGYQANFGDYLMRWVFRLIDIYISSGIVGVTSIILSKYSQRLGDIATGTAVISLKNNIQISHTIIEQLEHNYLPTYPQVVILSDNDMQIIKNHFQKAIITNDKIVLQKLSDKVKEILKLEKIPTEFTEQKFIDTIIKDYNYYTGKEN